MPYLLYYSASDFTYTDSNGTVFSGLPPEAANNAGGQGTGTAAGSPPYTITLNPGATPTIIEVNDDDTLFHETEPGGTPQSVVGTGSGFSAAYTLYQNGNNTGDFVTALHLQSGSLQGLVGPVDGLVSSFEFVPGVPVVFNGDVSSYQNELPYDAYLACFTEGTLIETGSGAVPIETLEVGDRVWTRDGGLQPIRWIGTRHLSPEDLLVNPEFRPVRIRAGALGNDRDLLVSPEHRMVLRDEVNELLFGSDTVLVAAKSLIDGDTVVHDEAVDGVRYYHILFDKHEIVRANGAESESYHPSGAHAMGLDEGPRRELLALFPELENADASVFAAARPVLKPTEIALLKEMWG